MKLEADVREMIAKLQATLGQHVTPAGGSDHACRPRGCAVCERKARMLDRAARKERRRGKTYGPPPAGEDIFKGFR